MLGVRDDAARGRLPGRPVHARAGPRARSCPRWASSRSPRSRCWARSGSQSLLDVRRRSCSRCRPSAALSVLAIGLAPGRRAATAAALSDAASDRGLADRRRRPRGWRAAARARAPGGRGRRDRLLPRALDGRAGAGGGVGDRDRPARGQRPRAAGDRGRARRAATPTMRRSTRTSPPRASRDRVRHVRKFSADAHGDVDGPLSLLYVDGAHRFGPARADLARLGRGASRPAGRCSSTTRSRRSA